MQSIKQSKSEKSSSKNGSIVGNKTFMAVPTFRIKRYLRNNRRVAVAPNNSIVLHEALVHEATRREEIPVHINRHENLKSEDPFRYFSQSSKRLRELQGLENISQEDDDVDVNEEAERKSCFSTEVHVLRMLMDK